MSADNFDSRFSLGPSVFSRVDPDRILKLQTNTFMRLKVLASEIFEMDCEDEETQKLYQDFVLLLKRNGGYCGARFADISTKLFFIENFGDEDLVEGFQELLFEKLIFEGWSANEILCTHSIEVGTFGINELEK